MICVCTMIFVSFANSSWVRLYSRVLLTVIIAFITALPWQQEPNDKKRYDCVSGIGSCIFPPVFFHDAFSIYLFLSAFVFFFESVFPSYHLSQLICFVFVLIHWLSISSFNWTDRLLSWVCVFFPHARLRIFVILRVCIKHVFFSILFCAAPEQTTKQKNKLDTMF